MKRVSLNDVQSIPDFAQKDNFNFVLGNTPGGSTDRKLHIKCNSITFPPLENEPIIVNLWGHKVKHRGKFVPPQDITVTYYEDNKYRTLKALRSWHNAVVNPVTGSTAYGKVGYTTISELSLYDQKGHIGYGIGFVNMFPKRIEGFELSGDSSGPILISVNFGYDYMVEVGSFGGIGGLLTGSSALGGVVNTVISNLGLSANVLGIDVGLNPNGLTLNGGGIGLTAGLDGVGIDTGGVISKAFDIFAGNGIFGGNNIGQSNGAGGIPGAGTLGDDSATNPQVSNNAPQSVITSNLGLG